MEIKNDDITFEVFGGKNETLISVTFQYLITKENGINLIILDLDKEDDKDDRTESIIPLAEKYVELNENQIFFMPKNDGETKGNLEDLILSIIPKEKQKFFACFDEYKNCVSAKFEADKNVNHNNFNNKDAVHQYLVLHLTKEEEITKESTQTMEAK